MSFRFSSELAELLLKYLHEYKIFMEGRSIDFNSDKPSQYEFVRKRFSEDNEAMVEDFRPAEFTRYMVLRKMKKQRRFREEKKLIERGYKSVQEKSKKSAIFQWRRLARRVVEWQPEGDTRKLRPARTNHLHPPTQTQMKIY